MKFNQGYVYLKLKMNSVANSQIPYLIPDSMMAGWRNVWAKNETFCTGVGGYTNK
jgi:hypothetical protein